MKTFKEFISEAKRVWFHGGDRPIENRTFDVGRETHNNLGFFGNVTTNRHGVFFSDNHNFSNVYGKVSKHNLNIRNTYDMDTNHYKDEIEHKFDPFGPSRDNWIRLKHGVRHAWQMFDGEIGKNFVEHLKSKGYDSAKFKEYIEDEHGNEHESNTHVVFDPKHIKNLK